MPEATPESESASFADSAEDRGPDIELPSLHFEPKLTGPALKAYRSIASKAPIQERFIVFDDFPGLGDLFEKTGLGHLWSVDHKIDSFPDLVRRFYACKTYDPDVSPLCLKSVVDRIHISLTSATLSSILQVSSAGADPSEIGMTDAEVLSTMFVKVPADFNKPRTMTDLTDVGKIVNKFIKHNLMPTRCAAQYVPACNVRLIYCILSGVRINWAHVILLKMCKSKDLAYSSSLTRIFMHFKVPLNCTALKSGQ